MRAARKRRDRDQIREEYDFTGGVRGKYAARFARGTNVVVLERDVAEVFKTGKAVNEALRAQIRKKPPQRARRRHAKR